MNIKKKLWVIEDMLDLHPVYQSIFDTDKFELKFSPTFSDFKEHYNNLKDQINLVIADILLSDGHFIQLLNDHDLTLSTPFLVISNCDTKDCIESAYQIGALDYILKPFNHNEINVKVNHHLFKIEEQNFETIKSLKALNLDLSKYTNKEVKIIESFNIREDKTLHRNDIVKIIWKNITIHPNTLDVHIYNLRKKLKQNGYGIKAIGNGLFKFIDL